VPFAVTAMARTLSVSPMAARDAVRRLDDLGALRVVERSKMGHVADMRRPEKIRAVRPGKKRASIFAEAGDPAAGYVGSDGFLEKLGAAESDSRSRARRPTPKG